jgi:hypothetical protein
MPDQLDQDLDQAQAELKKQEQAAGEHYDWHDQGTSTQQQKPDAPAIPNYKPGSDQKTPIPGAKPGGKNLTKLASGGAVPGPSPILQLQDYGPIDNEYSHDQLFGPLGHLKDGYVALSPDHLKTYPLGSGPYNLVSKDGIVLATGLGVADKSYISPGNPNHDTLELWNRKAPADEGHLVPAAGWKSSGFVPNTTGFSDTRGEGDPPSGFLLFQDSICSS